jgi:hypothetical protein
VKREANKIADCLANEGVDSKEEMIQLDARISPAPQLLIRCMDIFPKRVPPQMGCHVAQMVPHSPHATQVINKTQVCLMDNSMSFDIFAGNNIPYG